MSGFIPAAEAAQSRLDRDAVEAAVEVAVRAPSIHNTQPWRWVFDGETLTLRCDRTRQLNVADPSGHSMMISCGAALALTELALRAGGWDVDTARFPDAADRDVLAQFRGVSRQEPDEATRVRIEAALHRHSDRRPFIAQQVAPEAMEELREATSASDVYVDFPTREDQQIDLAAAVSWADRVERHDEAYLAEINTWLRDPDVRATSDGIPLDAVPHVSEGHPRHTNVPVRDFEVGITGRQLIEQDIDEHPLIGVIFSQSDSANDHLRSGEIMMRLMIEAELLALATCPLSQAVDLTAFRSRVQGLMGWTAFPQMMLRIGYPSPAEDRPPSTPRRPLSAVFEIVGD